MLCYVDSRNDMRCFPHHFSKAGNMVGRQTLIHMFMFNEESTSCLALGMLVGDISGGNR